MAEESNNTNTRNFRSSYYEKLGFCGNEEKSILDLIELISSCPFELDKLTEFCERFDFDRKCVDSWKILLGVECDRKNPFDEFANVRRVRNEHFESLKHSLEVLLRHNVVIRNRLNKSSKLESKPLDNHKHSQENFNQDDQNNPGRQLTLMYLLEAGRLDSSNIDAQLESNYCRKMSAMALFFANVSSDLQEAFFLFRNFTRKLEANEALEKAKINNNK